MINTLTLNPAIDRIIYLDKLSKNQTNRILKINDVLGGKGTHVSINLSILGIKNRAFGVAFGKTGKEVIEILEKEGVLVNFIWKEDHETRINYLIVENANDCTIMSSKGIMLENDITNELLIEMHENILDEDYVIFSGDASNSLDTDIYNKILQSIKHKNPKVFLDTSGKYLENALSISPFLIKPNKDELSFLCKKELKTEKDIIEEIIKLKKYKIEVIAVSLGKEGSIVCYQDNLYRAIPPDVNVSNTIGCGDSYISGLIYGFHQKKNIEETLCIATAVSSATAESSLSVGFDLSKAYELMSKVIIKKI